MPVRGRAIERIVAGTAIGAPDGPGDTARGSEVAAPSVASGSAAGTRPPTDEGSVHRIAAITRNEAALMTNARVTPPAATRTPPRAGPTTNPRLSRLE